MKKINLPTKPIFIENKNFQTILISIIFPYQEKITDLAKQTLLPNMLLFMNENYQTEEEFQKKIKENYILDYSVKQITIGTTAAFIFNLTIPDTHTLKKDYIERQILFFKNAIFNPKTIDNGFDPFEVEREKENLKIGIKNNNKNFKTYLKNRIRKLADNKGIFSTTLEDHQEQIDEVTPQNLYDYYKEKIRNNTPIIFAMGNIEKEKISSILEKNFITVKEEKQIINTDYIHYLTPFRTTPQEVIETKNFKDSALSFIYKVKDMKKEDQIILSIITSLLTSLYSRLLNKKLRDENNLIYSSNVTFYPNFGVFEIVVFINPNNKERAKEKIKEVISCLSDEKLITPLLDNIKEHRRINLIKQQDNKYSIFNDEIYKRLEIGYTEKESYELTRNITAEDITNFMDRLKLDTIYFLKEIENE